MQFQGNMVLLSDQGQSTATAPLIPAGYLGMYFRSGKLVMRMANGAEEVIEIAGFAAGAQLGGTVDQDVYIDGDAEIVSDCEVHGSLIVKGKLTNAGGHALTVYGDMIVGGSIIFTPSDDEVEQGDVWILGDMMIGETSEQVTNDIEFSVSSYTPGSLRINASDDLSGYGVQEPFQITFTSGPLNGQTFTGMTFWFGQGDRPVFPSAPPSNPQPGDTFTTPVVQTITTVSEFKVNKGQSPSLYVDGDLMMWGSEFNCNGKDAANGLNIEVGGDLMSWNNATGLNCDGGPATETEPGGNGGAMMISGKMVIGQLTSRGGDTSFTGMSGGTGGNVYVNGDFNGPFNVSGGSGPGSGGQPGGSGGNGGYIEIGGDLNCVGGTFHANGGGTDCDDPLASGGVGGTILVHGNMNCRGGFMTADGGVRAGNTSGYVEGVQSPDGGSITCYGNVNMFVLNANGNSSAMRPEVNSSGGNGGSIHIYGDFWSDGGCSASGGACRSHDSVGYNAGNGGSVNIRGRCFAGQGVAAVGGDATEVANSNQRAGDGGTIWLGSVQQSADNPAIWANGGHVTEGSSASGRAGNGGTIYFYGPASSMKFITVDGGHRLAGSNDAPGGNGGTMKFGGPFLMDGPDQAGSYTISANGGNSVNGDGGNAGLIEFFSFSAIDDTVKANGGNGSSDAGAGGTITFRAGCAVHGSVQVLDGTGVATNTATRINLSGHCAIKTINMTNKATAQIRASSDVPALLKVNALTAKNVLTNHDGTGSTANLTSDIAASMFSYDIAGKVWYKHTGTAA